MVVVVVVLMEVVVMDHNDGGSTGGGLTILPQVQLVHGVDVAEVGHPGLDLGAALPGGLVDALDHLLLLVDPVQMATEHCQAHRLQDVGVGDDDPVGSWEVKGQPTKTPGAGGVKWGEEGWTEHKTRLSSGGRKKLEEQQRQQNG